MKGNPGNENDILNSAISNYNDAGREKSTMLGCRPAACCKKSGDLMVVIESSAFICELFIHYFLFSGKSDFEEL